MNGTPSWSIGIDVGGTYVDAVLIGVDGRVLRHKIPRSRADAADAVLAMVDTALEASGITPDSIIGISHGSTLVTNLLAEQGAKPVAIVTNQGFADVLTIGRQSRAELYAFSPAPQVPVGLFPPHLRFEIPGRTDATGEEIAPLEAQGLGDLAARIADSGVEAVAICLLHAIRNPANELAVAAALHAARPEIALSLSHQVDVAPGEFERFLATALDAYVKPATRRYLQALRSGLKGRGLPAPAIVMSDGSTRDLDKVLDFPLQLALAGPAAAMRGFALHGVGTASITLETGGTTTDIGLIDATGIVCGRKVALAGMPVSLRAADILSVPVGGGSVVTVNAAGALRLGPQSMGSLPGPVAFGKGGTIPTLTDALVVLGRLPRALAGGLVLDKAGAEGAMAPIAQALGCSVEDAARAVVATAATMIAEGVKAHAYRHGIDPSAARLIAGGGGGPQHAAEVAALLGASSVIVHPDAAVISALGCLAAPAMDAVETPLELVLDGAGWEKLLASCHAITAEAGAKAIRWSVEMVYQGQSASLEIALDPVRDDRDTLAERFDAAHARIRGHAFDRPRLIQRLRAEWVTQPALLSGALADADAGLPDEAMQGPCALFTDTTSIWLPPGWVSVPSSDGLILQRRECGDWLEGAA